MKPFFAMTTKFLLLGLLAPCLCFGEKLSKSRLILDSYLNYWEKANSHDPQFLPTLGTTAVVGVSGGIMSVASGEPDGQIPGSISSGVGATSTLFILLGEATGDLSPKARLNKVEEGELFRSFKETEGLSAANQLLRDLTAEWDLEHLLSSYSPDAEGEQTKKWLAEERQECEKIILPDDLPSAPMRERAINVIAAERVLYRILAKDEGADGQARIQVLLEETKQKAIEQLKRNRLKLQALHTSRHAKKRSPTHEGQ